MTREVYAKLMETLNKLEQLVDEAICQLEGYGLGKEEIGFAKNEDGYGLG